MRGRLLVAAALIGVLARCGSAPRGADPTFTPGEPLPESSFVPGPSASYMGLVLTGELVLGDDGCVRLDPVPASMAPEGLVDILWPVGTTLRTLPSGRAEVVWPDGSVVATAGGQLRASGGLVSAQAAPPCIGPDGAFQLEAMLPLPP